ncbi:uncharacterized protein DEA37_0004417 [Paragonimus westermani]|uniref:Queuosine 5'-phosphate N-glycosylase/hydrolase n=1 Tax=Paragonimus westermani TaxID=34504 RepID=A0A5J4ND29_9TREM|nr:uncharacterized protein DEA37_0004417 [Paragonimus westermani]
MSSVLTPAASAEFVVLNADHVSLDPLGVNKLADQITMAISSGTLGLKNWTDQELTPNLANDRAVEWIFVTDLLNFSFWTDTGLQYEVLYNQKVHTGYWSLCAAVNRAIDDGFDLLDPNTYQHITESDLRFIFRSANGSEIPLFGERLRLLHEAGKTLVRNFNGSFINVVNQCNNSALKLLDLICEWFPSFRDCAVYRGQQISFLKRAQILVGDLWSCFGGKGWGYFYDIDEITAFADYRVPQVLFFFGALKYDVELTNLLHRGASIGELIPNGSPMEVEIRAASIHAVQLIVQQVKQRLGELLTQPTKIHCNAILVDNYIWNYRRDHAQAIDETIPMHRTRCLFY